MQVINIDIFFSEKSETAVFQYVLQGKSQLVLGVSLLSIGTSNNMTTNHMLTSNNMTTNHVITWALTYLIYVIHGVERNSLTYCVCRKTGYSMIVWYRVPVKNRNWRDDKSDQPVLKVLVMCTPVGCNVSTAKWIYMLVAMYPLGRVRNLYAKETNLYGPAHQCQTYIMCFRTSWHWWIAHRTYHELHQWLCWTEIFNCYVPVGQVLSGTLHVIPVSR